MKIKKQEIFPDPLYNNISVAKFINYIMRKGKKSLAQKIVYKSFDIVKEKAKQDPIDVFEKAIQNASPILEVKSKRIGGANYQVPVEVQRNRRISLAMSWIVEAAKGEKGSIQERLANELIEASKNGGKAVRKKENVHKMAEANKAFAHFAF